MSIAKEEAQSFGKVGVLFGGRSAERDVSIMSGTGVLQALQSQGIDAHAFDPGQRSLAELAAEKFDRVFIALHGRYGEDGTLQGALELLGIPYTGSGVMASAMAMDKITTKILWLKAGLPTPEYAVLHDDSDLAAVAAKLGLPLIVKPPHEGSSIGFSKVEALEEFAGAYAKCAPLDDSVLAESFVAGREFTVAVLGTGAGARALPVVEIVAPKGNYDYQNKYFTDDVQYFCPPQLDEAIQAEMRRIAVEAYRTLDCEGWARIDVLLRESDNRPFLLEANTSPGMTSHSLVPMAARAEGMSYEALCVEILRSARLKTKG
ncbi:D-alanine--D-alanine ligase [Massilia sp. METH4]|uniref:D-alanine--D-alanine ligase n=1 Tax=Massilia sp. METH4 TaxID=3123041 RepID=UPI0030CB9650